MSLLADALTVERLDAALDDLVETAGVVRDAVLGQGALEELRPSLRRLVECRDSELRRLADDARSASWSPRPVITVEIEKRSGGVRRLGIPCMRERVLERSLLGVLSPVLEPHLGPGAFGYRPGIGIGDALRAILVLRELGYTWVVRTDIDDCFPSISRSRVVERLATIVGDDPVVELVAKLLGRPYRHGRTLRHHEGLAQGSSLSPLLSNLFLVDFDEALFGDGHQIVRYADDCVVLARSQKEGLSAMETAQRAAQELGLRLGSDKSELLDFATGFCFLGEDINHRYPPLPTNEPSDAPHRRVLYVGVQGAYVSVGDGRVRVSRKKVELLSVPKSRVERIVAFGSVTVAPGARSFAARDDVDIVFCSRSGRLVSFLQSAGRSNTSRRRSQYAATAHAPTALAVAKSIIRGKLHNQRVLLQRSTRPDVAAEVRKAVSELDAYAATLPEAPDVDSALGVEGICARSYFAALSAIMPAGMKFAGRSTRPPGDVVNAALSYGYAILASEAATACAAAGLDPAAGFMHTDQPNRPSLALDLMEEFRPVIVDAAVVSLIRNGRLTSGHGRRESNRAGVWLTENGRRSVVAAVERRLLTRSHHPRVGQRVSLRRIVHVQAQGLARVVELGEAYEPFLRRV